MLHRYRLINGLRFHFVEAGVGPPVLFLHGFPEFWYAWRHQLPALASAGFRAIAPDLRGYNETERPKALSAYRPSALVADVASLIREVAREPVFLVGHDWGGVLAWRCAALFPQLIRKLIILNAPHPEARREALRRRPWLWLQSLYVLFFQLPHFPQRVLRSNDFSLLEHAWRKEPVHPAAYTAEDITRYKNAFASPGALTGPLNYYRAAFRYSQDLFDPPTQVEVPTLVLWGEQDPYLNIHLIENLDRWVRNLEIQRFPGSSHWIQNDIPDLVNLAIIALLGR